VAHETIKNVQAKGLDENAMAAIDDASYCSTMSDYGRDVKRLTDDLWKERFTECDCGNVMKDGLSSYR